MNKPPASDASATVRRKAQQRNLVSRVKSLWQRQQSADALEFLREHSSVRADRALSLELAYEEYCIRRDNGEAVDISSFCRRFPSISRSLARQIEVDEFVRLHPSLIDQQAAVSWPRRGDVLFGFVVVEEIGRGAFARAYLCAQPGIGNRQVVVKVSRGGALEADTMGGLDHPNIMSVYSVQVDPESKLSGICMPFVGRSTLYDVIDVAHSQGRPPQKAGVILEASRALARRGDRYHQVTPRVSMRPGSPYVTGALQLVLQLADALGHAHERGVLHGDLKPSNVVMTVSGIPMLVDFNLSQSRESNNLVTGGTLPYMAPEQIRSMLLGGDEQDRVDQRSDVFSLGAILFELLTGRLPFESSVNETEPFAAAGRMLDAQWEGAGALRQLTRQLDPGLTDLLVRCLSFDPQQRPHDIRVMGEQIRRHLSSRHRLRRYLQQHRRFAAGALVGLTLAGLASALAWAQQPPLRDRRFRQGVAAYHRQDYASAIELLNQAVAADREFANAYLARGCAAMRRYELDKFEGWLDAAYRDFMLAVRYGGRASDVVAARAFCLVQKREFELASRDLETLYQEGNTSVQTANNLAYCYEKMTALEAGDPANVERLILAADRLLREAQSLGGKIPQPYINLGILELRRYRLTDGKYLPTAGLESIRKAIEFGANETATYFFAAKLAGVMADETGDEAYFEECLQYLEHAVELGHKLEAGIYGYGHPFDILKDRPGFRALLQRKNEGAAVTYAVRFLAPDVMSSQFSLGDGSDL